MKNPELSIVIITLKEENYLPKLLNSIKSQKYKNYEIIVSDAGSKDKTLEIAKKFKCKIVKGGLPAKGRNSGARAAKGKYILFLDADTLLPENFLGDAVSEFKERNLDVAGCYTFPEIRCISNRIIMCSYNLIIKIFQYFSPIAGGWCILSKKELHKKINGFNENIIFSEDIEYVERAGKTGKFRILKKPFVYMSLRRFENEGKSKMVLKYILTYLYRTLTAEEFCGKNDELKYFKYDLDYKK